MTPLPGTTNEGYRVVMCKLLDTDASKYNYVDSNKLWVISFYWYESTVFDRCWCLRKSFRFSKFQFELKIFELILWWQSIFDLFDYDSSNLFSRFCMVTDLWLAKEGIASGHSLVVDMEGSTLAHLAKVNLMAMKKFMYFIQVNFDNSQKIAPEISIFNLYILLDFRKHCQFGWRHCISSMQRLSWTNYWLWCAHFWKKNLWIWFMCIQRWIHFWINSYQKQLCPTIMAVPQAV